MAGPNQPEFEDDELSGLFAAALFADEEPTDVDKEPLGLDGLQPPQTILTEEPNV